MEPTSQQTTTTHSDPLAPTGPGTGLPPDPTGNDPIRNDPTGDEPGYPPLWGRGLRFVLVEALMGRPSMTVADLVAVVDGHGYHLGGRASKVISDALRWEVRRGRVLRLGRGQYRYHQAPVSTARRIRLFARRCHTWIGVAVTRTAEPPPTPPNRRPHPSRRPDDPTRAPWATLGWLWTT